VKFSTVCFRSESVRDRGVCGLSSEEFTCRSPAITTVLQCLNRLRVPSVALYVVKPTFSGGFESLPLRHTVWVAEKLGCILAKIARNRRNAAIPSLKPDRALRIIGAIGSIPSFMAKFWHHAFLFTFGWEYFGIGHMQRGSTWWILPWVMPAVLLISFVDLDT